MHKKTFNVMFGLMMISFTLVTKAAFASLPSGSFHIRCQELLDLAKFDTKVDQRVDLNNRQPVEFNWSLMANDKNMQPTTMLRVSLIETVESMGTAYVKLTWENSAYGSLVESREKILHFFKNEKKLIDLDARSYGYVFRNSCYITFK